MLFLEEADFDWTRFDKQLLSESNSDHVLYPIKIPVGKKEIFKAAIDRYACKHQIVEKDTAVTAGKVIGILLGVCQ